MARPSAFARLLDHFHTHPRGRLHEILFWVGLGAVVGGGAFALWTTDRVSTPIAWLLWIVAICFVGFGLLPQRRVERPPPPKGKRGQIQEQVKKSKAERKNQGPPPPGPPIRRG